MTIDQITRKCHSTYLDCNTRFGNIQYIETDERFLPESICSRRDPSPLAKAEVAEVVAAA
jgi:hypothetical protein